MAPLAPPTSPEELLAWVRAVLRGKRFSLQREKKTQQEMAAVFTAAGVPFQREFWLSPADQIDFLVGGTLGIEVKLRGQPSEILLQCERYAAHGRVRALLLVTNERTVLPTLLCGKPTGLLNLGLAWL